MNLGISQRSNNNGINRSDFIKRKSEQSISMRKYLVNIVMGLDRAEVVTMQSDKHFTI